jgi:predicted NAD/FAD-binding protein
MVFDLVKFNRNARTLLATGGDGPSLGHWLDEGNYSKPFVERLIVPQASAVWSADPRQMWTFPARFLVEFFDNHGMLGFAKRPQWRTISGGSRSYVDAITASLRDLRLATPVRSITRDADGVTVDGERFDEVVLATHSDQALKLLGEDATDRERELLGAIPYQPNEAVLHTDTRLLPRRKRAWASWNYHLLPEPTGMTTVTYHMNRLQALTADREFCVTLNRGDAIDPGKVLRRFSYAHPVFTGDGARAQARWHEISGVNRTHFAGAYWRWGFHEDGVASAARVAEHFGARL